MLKRLAAVLLLIAAAQTSDLRLQTFSPNLLAQPSPGPAIRYRLSFPEPQHRWMQVEADFPNPGSNVLELRMSRSSPGRYSLHDFAKNVYDVRVIGGGELDTMRPDPYGWNVKNVRGGAVTMKYKVYGDRVDGTYLAIDETHAHINMPAAIMWAHGLEERPIAIDFERPAGTKWQVATQLHQRTIVAGSFDRPVTEGTFSFTAANLQYLMDSPVEFGPVVTDGFVVNGSQFRIAMHHTGTDEDLRAFTQDVEKIVRQEGAIYGEFPEYEPGSYTFLTDLLPWANGDGMEHRNSTVITLNATLASGRDQVLDSVAHEFFHCWNVERIRPKGLEPFDFDRANLSGDLWLAEGFTQYYGPLALARAGLDPLADTVRTIGGLVNEVTNEPGRSVRSAEQMSQMASFIDGGRTVDRTNWSNTVISYYSFGGAVALALDLTLRDRTDSRLSLDDFMRAMWQKFGKPGGSREGYVDRPYTIADAEATLAEVAGDRAFARDFFARYIQGHDAADYKRLLARAGFVVQDFAPWRAWMGDLRYDSRGGRVIVATLVAPTWPAHAAGLEQDDELTELDGQRIAAEGDVLAVLTRHQPGDTITITYIDRGGRSTTAPVTLAKVPKLEVVPIETTTAGTLSQAQRTFRQRWLGPK